MVRKVILMKRAPLALLVASFVWGLSVPLATAVLHHLTAADLVLVENVAGTLVVGAAALLARRSLAGPWRPSVVLGALEPGLAYILVNLGLQRTTAAAGSMLLALESVFIAGLGWLLLRERVRTRETYALTLGLAGAALVALAETGGAGSWSGDALVVLGSLAAAGYAVAARRLAAGQDQLGLVFRQGVAAVVLTSPYVLWSWSTEGSRLPSASMLTLGLAALEGVVGFAVPFVLWAYAAPHVRTGVAGVAINLVPVVGVLTSAVVGLGRPSPGQLVGGLLILGGVALLSVGRQSRPDEPVATAADRPLVSLP
jgi:drug/metabolite transporter (DMT)-like permease